ncbi:hypothetical protein [Methylosinus sp. RM1]|nr:hypothetical protein [Methylosinus sp. RM1]
MFVRIEATRLGVDISFRIERSSERRVLDAAPAGACPEADLSPP